VLTPGGLFLFSVEQADPGHDLQLRASSRYAHSSASMQSLAARHGMTQRALHAAALREDQGRPVMGWVVLLQR
jgi:predicted TPR repeat methyltransferase